jgi:hypothetical protein
LRARSRRAGAGLAVVVAVASSLGACASNPARSGVTPNVAITSGKGAWTRVELDDKSALSGELIAFDEARPALWLLTSLSKLERVPLERVHSVELGVYENHLGPYVAWVFLGSFSTLSHGYFLILSLPAWILFGSAAAAAESYEGRFQCATTLEGSTAEPCGDALEAYARFPQGLPPGVDEDAILGRKKPTPAKPASPSTWLSATPTTTTTSPTSPTSPTPATTPTTAPPDAPTTAPTPTSPPATSTPAPYDAPPP